MNNESTDKKPSEAAIAAAILCYATPETSMVEVDTRIAWAMAQKIDEIWSKPWLGNATTFELIAELQARAEVHGYGSYRTVDDQPSLIKEV